MPHTANGTMTFRRFDAVDMTDPKTMEEITEIAQAMHAATLMRAGQGTHPALILNAYLIAVRSLLACLTDPQMRQDFTNEFAARVADGTVERVVEMTHRQMQTEGNA